MATAVVPLLFETDLKQSVVKNLAPPQPDYDALETDEKKIAAKVTYDTDLEAFKEKLIAQFVQLLTITDESAEVHFGHFGKAYFVEIKFKTEDAKQTWLKSDDHYTVGEGKIQLIENNDIDVRFAMLTLHREMHFTQQQLVTILIPTFAIVGACLVGLGVYAATIIRWLGGALILLAIVCIVFAGIMKAVLLKQVTRTYSSLSGRLDAAKATRGSASQRLSPATDPHIEPVNGRVCRGNGLCLNAIDPL